MYQGNRLYSERGGGGGGGWTFGGDLCTVLLLY